MSGAVEVDVETGEDGVVVHLRYDFGTLALIEKFCGLNFLGVDLDPPSPSQMLDYLWACVVRHAEYRGQAPPFPRTELGALITPDNLDRFVAAMAFISEWQLHSGPSREN